MIDIIKYFEAGCLCILSGGLLTDTGKESDEQRASRYMRNCVCSRHPDTALGKIAPLHRKVLMLNAAMKRNKEAMKIRQGAVETDQIKDRISMAFRLNNEVVAEALRLANEESLEAARQ